MTILSYMTRTMVFFLTLKSLGLITKPRLKSMYYTVQFKRQSNIQDEYENLRQLFDVWPNSIESLMKVSPLLRSPGHLLWYSFESFMNVFVICGDLIDRSHALSELSPLSTFLTGRCHPGHWDCELWILREELRIIGNLNLSRGASG